MNETNKKTETTKSLEENTAERPYNLQKGEDILIVSKGKTHKGKS